MSPSDIEVLIWYHCCPDRHPRYEAPAVQEATRTFKKHGLIEPAPEDREWKTTEKGKFLIDMLCATPFPESRFVDPRIYDKGF